MSLTPNASSFTTSGSIEQNNFLASNKPGTSNNIKIFMKRRNSSEDLDLNAKKN